MARFSTNAVMVDASSVDITANTILADVSMRTKMSLQFVASGVSSGNGVFTVEVSNDGINWVAYNRLTTNVTNTNAQNDTRVASITLSSNTSSIVFFPLGDYFRYMRVNLNVTTDGVYSAILQAVD